MEFSIIIPLYNKEKYIQRSLDSILKQDFTNFEIVVVDDGSSDNSASVVKQNNDSRIRLISKKNGGVSSARNRGFKEALGEWLLFLDADDILLPGALSSFHEAIIKYPDIKVIISNFQDVDLNGNITKHSKLNTTKVYENPLKGIWYREFASRPGNTIYHRYVLSIMGGFNESITYNEDNEFTERILTQYKNVYIPSVTMQYIKTEGGASLKIHPLEQDYVYYLKFLAINSRWQKLRHGGLISFGRKRFKNTSEYNKLRSRYKDFYTIRFRICLFLQLAYRRIRNIMVP